MTDVITVVKSDGTTQQFLYPDHHLSAGTTVVTADGRYVHFTRDEIVSITTVLGR